jgi:hypothetical protein
MFNSGTSLAGCQEVNGMLAPQFIPEKNIALKDVTRVPEEDRNVFLADPKGKARIDSILADGTPIDVTQVELISELGDSEFRIKYKDDESAPAWLDVTEDGSNKIAVSSSIAARNNQCIPKTFQTFTNKAVFVTPLKASSVRMLVRNPTDTKTPFVVTLNIDACYEGIIAEIGMLFITVSLAQL